MPIYQLTNKKTHSRAVVIARSEQEACEMRPDGAFWRHGSWMIWDSRAQGIVTAKALPEWPVTPEGVCADLLARHVESRFDVQDTVAFQRETVSRSEPIESAQGVLVFQKETTPRQRGEGPDSWWENDEDDA